MGFRSCVSGKQLPVGDQALSLHWKAQGYVSPFHVQCNSHFTIKDKAAIFPSKPSFVYVYAVSVCVCVFDWVVSLFACF